MPANGARIKARTPEPSVQAQLSSIPFPPWKLALCGETPHNTQPMRLGSTSEASLGLRALGPELWAGRGGGSRSSVVALGLCPVFEKPCQVEEKAAQSLRDCFGVGFLVLYGEGQAITAKILTTSHP